MVCSINNVRVFNRASPQQPMGNGCGQLAQRCTAAVDRVFQEILTNQNNVRSLRTHNIDPSSQNIQWRIVRKAGNAMDVFAKVGNGAEVPVAQDYRSAPQGQTQGLFQNLDQLYTNHTPNDDCSQGCALAPPPAAPFVPPPATNPNAAPTLLDESVQRLPVYQTSYQKLIQMQSQDLATSQEKYTKGTFLRDHLINERALFTTLQVPSNHPHRMQIEHLLAQVDAHMMTLSRNHVPLPATTGMQERAAELQHEIGDIQANFIDGQLMRNLLANKQNALNTLNMWIQKHIALAPRFDQVALHPPITNVEAPMPHIPAAPFAPPPPGGGNPAFALPPAPTGGMGMGAPQPFMMPMQPPADPSYMPLMQPPTPFVPMGMQPPPMGGGMGMMGPTAQPFMPMGVPPLPMMPLS